MQAINGLPIDKPLAPSFSISYTPYQFPTPPAEIIGRLQLFNKTIVCRDPDQIVYVKKVPSSSASADNTRTNSIIDPHILSQKRRKSLKSFRNASLDIGSYLHPDGNCHDI